MRPRDWSVVETHSSLIKQFAWCSFLLSMGQATVSCTIGLALAELGAGLGSTAIGVTLLFYCTSALLIASSLIKMFGTKQVLISALALYYIFGLCYFVGFSWHQSGFFLASKAVTVLGSICGGIGGGLLWTAQGAYFSAIVSSYSLVTPETSLTDENMDEKSSSKLGAVFATFLIGCEVMVNLSVSGVMSLYQGSSTEGPGCLVGPLLMPSPRRNLCFIRAAQRGRSECDRHGHPSQGARAAAEVSKRPASLSPFPLPTPYPFPS